MNAAFSPMDHAAQALTASELQHIVTVIATCERTAVNTFPNTGRNARAEAMLSGAGMAERVTSRGVLSDSECQALADQRAAEVAAARKSWKAAQPVINVLAVSAFAFVAYLLSL